MSVKPIHDDFIDENDKKSKSLKNFEKILYNNWQNHATEKDDQDTGDISHNPNTSRWQHFQYNFLKVLQWHIKSNAGTQLEVFQSSMKYCLVIGQCLGLFPIMNITGRDVWNKYNILSWRYVLCIIILLGQIMITALNFYSLSFRYNFSAAGLCVLFTTNLVLNVQFIRLSTKWHHLMELVTSSNLDEYVDPYVKFKCNTFTVLLFTLGLIEHALSIICPFLKMSECSSDVTIILRKTIIITYPWIFGTVLSYSLGAFAIVEFFVLTITMIWTYSNVFIIWISLFLTSILERLNEKITSHDCQHLPASYWRTMREDYNRAVRLVHFFDEEISGIVFVTFGSSLFFICSRLYYLFGKGVSFGSSDDFECLHQQVGYRYEDLTYNLISGVIIIFRSFLVLLVAANIHSTSLVVAPSLYDVPSSSFCSEVQRFTEQIHGTTVALSGLNFFYVTKELLLSIFGTVVTYELVLLHFRREKKME